MAKSRNPRKTTKEKPKTHPSHKQKHQEKPHSWAAMKSLFTCKYLHVHNQHQHVQNQEELHEEKKIEEKEKQKLKLTQEPQQQKQKLKQAQEEQLTLSQLQEEYQNKKKEKQKLEQTLQQLEAAKSCQKSKKQGKTEEPTQEIQQEDQEMFQKQKMKQAQDDQTTLTQLQEEIQNKQKQKQKLKQTLEQLEAEKSSQKSKKQGKTEQLTLEELNKKSKKMKCSGSLCSNTKVMHRPELSASPPEEQKKRATMVAVSNSSSSSSSSFTIASTPPSISGSFRNIRKLSGCYECRMVVDPVLGMTRDPSLRNSIRSCSECGEVFMKAENLELHQAVRHAVSELGPEDTSKNIVEIIFQSSWLKKQAPVCKIDRILKVQNTPKTISKFEEYRDTIKTKATRLPKKHPRCLADGNELLRFHCTTLMCSLGLNGSSNLCNSIPNCSVCSIIKNGFRVTSGIPAEGILTTATSGKAHDNARVTVDGRRAMLVCRVIAGRVKKNPEGSAEDYDSVAGVAGVYSNLDELYVFNPKAILPCFVVIYGGF